MRAAHTIRVQSLASVSGAWALSKAPFRRADRRTRLIVRSGDGDNLDDLFKRELEKRQISSLDDIPNEPAPTRAQTRATPPPGFARQEDDVPDQLKKSRELNSEGLEGLPGRASQLLQLGLSFFLAFGPFIAAVVLAFFAIYAVFGSAFVHQGSTSGPPPYIDPQELLNEPTADPMVPF